MVVQVWISRCQCPSVVSGATTRNGPCTWHSCRWYSSTAMDCAVLPRPLEDTARIDASACFEHSTARPHVRLTTQCCLKALRDGTGTTAWLRSGRACRIGLHEDIHRLLAQRAVNRLRVDQPWRRDATRRLRTSHRRGCSCAWSASC